MPEPAVGELDVGVADAAVQQSRRSLAHDVAISAIWAVVATGASFLIARAIEPSVVLDPLEAFAVLTSYSCTYLVVRQRRINYLVGMASTAAYALLFHRAELLASMVLNLYLTPSLIYGWFRWRPDADTRPVTNVALRWSPVYLAVTAASYVGAVAMVGWFDGELPRWDAVILIGSILAQFLLDNKKLQTWVVWAVVNVVAIYVYARADLPMAAAQYVFFLANTVYGYRSWRRSMAGSTPAALPAEVVR